MIYLASTHKINDPKTQKYLMEPFLLQAMETARMISSKKSFQLMIHIYDKGRLSDMRGDRNR